MKIVWLIGAMFAGGACTLVANADPAPVTPASAPAQPQLPASVGAPSQPPAHSTIDPHLLAAGAVVEIQLTEAVNSKTAKRGDTFGLRLAQPIMIGDRIAVPAGAIGGGEVVYSQPAGLMGEAGKLVLAARYIDFAGQRLPLHAFKLGAGGEDHSTGAFVVAEAVGLVAGPVSLVAILIPGGNIQFPAGTLANAKLASDVTLSDLAPPAAPAPAAATTLAPTQTSTTQQATQ